MNRFKCFFLLIPLSIAGFFYFPAFKRVKQQFGNGTSVTAAALNRVEYDRGLSNPNISHNLVFKLFDQKLLPVLGRFQERNESEKAIVGDSKEVQTSSTIVFPNNAALPTQSTQVAPIHSTRNPQATGNKEGRPTQPGSITLTTKPIHDAVKDQPVGKLTYDDVPQVKVEAVNCAKLFENDKNEQTKADIYQKEHPVFNSSDELLGRQALNCPKFLSDRRYIRKPVSDEERRFSIAFAILLFKDVEVFERLLRAIYRPQNFYCIHVDKKSPKSVQDAVGAIAKCFENVFMAPEQFDVKWGTFSILEPELICMTELLKYKKWRYFINLTGQEFPLKTNWEIVQILKIFNGANNMEGTIKRLNPERTAHKPPPPANITLTKGSVHIVATRKYVRYLIYNHTAIKFREWVKDTDYPDETYYSTLNFNPHLKVPGSYLGVPETDTNKNLFITRFKNWGNGPFNWPCAGKRVRMVCIFAVRDLPLLASRVELFANKFHIDYEPLTLDCLEELHYNRTRMEIRGGPDINRKFYEDLDFVRNHT